MFRSSNQRMARQILEHDWSQSTIGFPEEWPPALRTILNLMMSSRFPMFVAWGPDLVFLYNDAYAPMLGEKESTALGRPFADVWHDIWSDILPLVESALAGYATWMEDLPITMHRSGHPEETHWTFSYSAAHADDGSIAGMFCACQETTQGVAARQEQTRILDTLRESETRFRNMADHAPVIMWVTDPRGFCTYLNPRWYEFTGQTREEAEGYGWLDATHPDDKDESGRIFLEANARAEAFQLEYRLRDASGQYRWAIDAASPRFGTDGEFLGYVGSVVDIDAQKRATEVLQGLNNGLESEVEQRTAERDRIWNVSRDMLGVADDRGVWQSVNPAWSRILGWRMDEIVGRTSEWMEHPDDIAKTRTEIASVVDGVTTREFVNRFRAKNGTYRTLAWTAVPDEGLMYCVARDVTEEHEQAEALAATEEALRQSQKMEAVGQLTGGLAHDFNNLLAGISGSLDMMQTRIAQGRVGELDRYMIGAQGAARRAAALTHRLLAFSRRQTLDPKPTDVNRLVAGMEDLIRRTVGPQVDVETVANGGLWSTLVDPNQLENALLNLCINARDAMPDGGKLTIETGNRWLDERAAKERDLPPGQYISMCVSDNGTGMPSDVIERAFDPFFTTKPIGVGTGLGLSMIYGFARQSGGQVRIYSEVGAGTMICVYLPRHHLNEVDEAQPVPEDILRGAEDRTVLVIDDEPLVRMLIVDAVEDLGYTALEASDGPQGIKVLRSDTPIDLLITDVGLPNGMNGRQVADAARELRPDLRVMFVTGYAENAVLSHGHLDPGMQVVTKPFDMNTLTRRIQEMMADR